MSDLYKQDGLRFFAASNTKDGFVSYFDDLFSEEECERLYVLKGGPGCGKSTFMKKLGTLAKKKGLSCEYFHCSSDPESLDGIIIKEKRIGVVDGTSPHVVEPQLAGAREIIINLGKGWDEDKLFANKGQIDELCQKKKNCYKDAYHYLYSKDVMDSLVYNLTRPNISFTKLEKSAQRLAKNILGGKNEGAYKEKIRITEAMSSLGKIRLFTFENMAKNCIFLKEPFEGSRLSHLYLSAVRDYVKEHGGEIYVSHKAENKCEINGVFLPSCGVSITLYDEDAVLRCDRNFKKCKIINCARFLDSKAMSHTKPLRRFYSKLSLNMENQALESLAKAGKIHADIEKIYRLCTDYKTVEKISDEYINKILNS